MNQIRKLTEQDLDAFVIIAANAYPGIKIVSEEDRRKTKERFMAQLQDPTIDLYGLFRQGQLLGGMRFHHFTMRLLSTNASAGGVGMVAVDLLHKKEKVARDMIAYFISYYREHGACMTMLYPFRPDFYAKMGFGYGAKMSRYTVNPASLPRGGCKENVRFLRTEDKPALRECYNRHMARTNGLIAKSDYELNRLFENPRNHIVGYWEGGQVMGYAVFSFRSLDPDNFLPHNIHIPELVHETPESLAGLLAFLHTQADQVNAIVFDLQDDTFHHLLHDPRDGTGAMLAELYHECNAQGVGIMYRVVDTRRVFQVLADHNFGGQTCALKLSVRDSFLPDNDGSVIVRFERGAPQLADDGCGYDVEIRLDISNFSSLLMGAVDFKHLYQYGLAGISDAQYVDIVNKLFVTVQKPVCLTWF